MSESCGVDCDQGRLLGCKTYCCRLLVRLQPDEMEPSVNGLPPKGFVDKTVDGYCVHFDRDSCLCAIWNMRPRTCREYDCNKDFMLQVALRNKFRTIVDLARAAATTSIPQDQYLKVPLTDYSNNRD